MIARDPGTTEPARDPPEPPKSASGTATTPRPDPLPEDDERQIDGYRLLSRLGRGGMGDVFLAEHKSGQRVALKLLGVASLDDPTLRRRFDREGRVLQKLEHPGIVSVVDRGVDARTSRPWLALELLAGRDLEQILSRRVDGRLSVPEATYVLARCAEALEAAHARGVIHRDVKPANLLLTPHAEVKLSDFGLALSQDVSLRLTVGEVLGTAAYMAPEVLLGEAWSYAADLYALGAVAFRVLVGRPLFEGSSATEIMCDQITRPPPPLAEVRFDAPPQLSALVGRLLDKDPAARPTAEQAARELAALAPEAEALAGLWSEAAVELPKPDSGSMALGPARRLRSGQTFLHYRIEEEVGRGGMGVVYRAWHFGLKRMVALKVLLAGALATDADRRRFLREAQAAGDLNHPGIVPVLDAGEHEGTYYITMAYVEGTPLGAWLSTGPAREARLRLFLRVCEGVQHAHNRGVIHRDLKPDNVLVGADASPFILDFGVAKRLDQEDTDHTTEQTTQGSLLGTLRYMSPEQAEGNVREVDVRSDVWALGTILYEMLCGTTPFRGSLRELLHQLHAGQAAPPSQHDPSVAWELDAICLKALEKDKNARYQSALDLQADLERYLAGLPILARRATRTYMLRKWVARHRAQVVTGAAVLTLVLILAAGWAGSVAATKASVRQGLVVEVRRLLERGRLQEASQAVRLAARVGDQEEVQDLVRQVAAAFVDQARQLEAELGREAPLETRRERLKQAQQLLEEAQRVDSGNLEVRTLLAAVYAEQGKLGQLEQEAALRAQAARLVEQARALEAKGDLGGARRAFDQALGFDGGSRPAREGLLEVERALAARQAQELQRAEQERVAELVGEARLSLQQGDLEGAQTRFTQALGFDGSNAAAQAGLVEVYRLSQERAAQLAQAQREERVSQRLAEAGRALEEARLLFRQGELPERIRERYFAAMEALREGLYMVPGHPEATRRLQEVARELSVVLVDQGYPELAGFILRVGGVEEAGPARGELPRDPFVTVVETEQAYARQVFGRVHFLPTLAFDRLREYVRSQTDKLAFVIEVRSEIEQTGIHPQMYVRELRVRMENRTAGTWSPPEVVKLEGGRFLRPVSVDPQGRRVVRPWDQSHGLDPKPAIKQVEGIVQRMVRDAKFQAERGESRDRK